MGQVNFFLTWYTSCGFLLHHRFYFELHEIIAPYVYYKTGDLFLLLQDYVKCSFVDKNFQVYK